MKLSNDRSTQLVQSDAGRAATASSELALTISFDHENEMGDGQRQIFHEEKT